MRRTQRGVTFIGWLFLLLPIAILGYAALRLVPVYLNYTKVARSMEQTSQESRPSDSATLVRASLEKRLDIEGIEFPSVKDFTIRRDGPAWVLEIEYEDTVPFISNLSLVARFSKSVRLGRAAE